MSGLSCAAARRDKHAREQKPRYDPSTFHCSAPILSPDALDRALRRGAFPPEYPACPNTQHPIARRPFPSARPEVFPVHRGKGFIVTGAAGGIGRAIAEHLLAQGAAVVVADLKEDAVRALPPRLAARVSASPMDVGSPESIAKGIAASERHLGRIDGLVNCAAIVRHCGSARNLLGRLAKAVRGQSLRRLRGLPPCRQST